MTNKNWMFLALIVIASLFYLINLGGRPLEDYDEATYASVLKSSFERSDFLSFEYFGHNWFEKPPLYFWLAAASVKVFGFNEFGLRFPAVILGVMAVGLVYLVVYELVGDQNAALFSGLTLMLSPFFIATTRNVRMDTPVTATILAGLYFYILGFKNEKYWLGVGISVGLGILFKSIIGLLAGPVILIWSIATQEWRWLKNRFFWLGNLAGFLIAAPWHIYENLKFGSSFWRDYLGYHVWGRFNQNILGSKITVSYYLSSLWTLSQPLIPLFIISLAAYLIFITPRKKLADTPRQLLANLAIICFIFGLFSLSKTKLITYYTPLYPFAVLAAGLTYVGFKKMARKNKGLIHLLAILIVIIFGYSGLSEWFYPQIYTTRGSADEKNIGLYLSRYSRGEEINVFGWDHHNTLRYYSSQLTQPLQPNGGRKPQIPSWLVTTTKTFDVNKALAKLDTPYRGQYLTLVHLTDEK